VVHDSFKAGNVDAMKQLNIGIAGGGIAGLASAIALATQSKSISVFERDVDFSATGAGLQLGPNAVRALRQLNAWQAVEPITSAPPAIHLRDGLSGKLVQTIPLGVAFEARYGAPYRTIARADLHSALLSVAEQSPNIKLHMESTLSATHPFDALIAADGVNSKIRQELWQVPAQRYDRIHYRAKANVPAGLDLALDCVTVWMLPGAHVVHYPLRSGLLNIVAAVQRSGLAEGWDHLTPATQVLSRFQSAHWRLQILLQNAEKWSAWSCFTVPALSTWFRGNVGLIGDAAHGMMPYLAQGAGMALEDAAMLGQSWLASDTISAAFSSFELRRKPRVMKLAKASLRQGRIYHASEPVRLVRNLVMQRIPEKLLSRQLDVIYKPRTALSRK
jgi:2-polyprenyl-6-methoxyphenol hydroxylase-like FAD-dependent oxidoreductase